MTMVPAVVQLAVFVATTCRLGIRNSKTTGDKCHCFPGKRPLRVGGCFCSTGRDVGRRDNQPGEASITVLGSRDRCLCLLRQIRSVCNLCVPTSTAKSNSDFNEKSCRHIAIISNTGHTNVSLNRRNLHQACTTSAMNSFDCCCGSPFKCMLKSTTVHIQPSKFKTVLYRRSISLKAKVGMLNQNK